MDKRLVIILDRLRSAHNVGNRFRIAEAVGASEIIFCGYTPAPPHPKLEKTAVGTDKMVPSRTAPDSTAAVRMLRDEGPIEVLAVDNIPGRSVTVWERSYARPLALVFGNEALGILPETLETVDGVVALPMLGQKTSINVGNAAAAILYEIIRNTVSEGNSKK
ncbi:MAG: hypothetical protein MJ025_02380 [Victivallaceae bacterium]|nr:hypothetical protein [Victivallaceae bacterium]